MLINRGWRDVSKVDMGIPFENPGLPKGIKSQAGRIGGGFTQDHHVVKKLDIQGAGCLSQLPGDLHVGARLPWACNSRSGSRSGR